MQKNDNSISKIDGTLYQYEYTEQHECQENVKGIFKIDGTIYQNEYTDEELEQMSKNTFTTWFK